MIFISVDLAGAVLADETVDLARRSVKSTSRSACDAAERLGDAGRSSRSGRSLLGHRRIRQTRCSDQEVILHPQHAGGVGLGDDRTVGDDVLRDAACRSSRRSMTAATPATIAPPWMRQDGLRTVANMRPSETASIAGGMASTPPIRISVRLLRLHHVVGGERHVVIVEEGGVDLRVFGEQVSQMRATLVTSQSAGWVSSTSMSGYCLTTDVEALGAALRAGVAERALGHDDRALAADGVDQRLGHRRAHELVVGREEACGR